MVSKVFKSTYFFLFTVLFFTMISCNPVKKLNSEVNLEKNSIEEEIEIQQRIKTGASQISKYKNLLKDKKIGIVANQTSVLFSEAIQHKIAEKTKLAQTNYDIKPEEFTHIVDTLVSLNYTISKVFSPEHGFRGTADASELIADSVDKKTGIPIVSLYGNNKKPTAEQLKDVEIVLFDIQDVGVRFYTYISTLHYVMEACAENNIPLIVLDRPNPNAHYIDGPTLDMDYQSFVGMHPVPLVYGMTIGEYAKMINGEKWLKDRIQCDLTVVPLRHYSHKIPYSLFIRPSPNLPNDKAINLYPSLGFFEGTPINAGRGTEFQFQRYGAPYFPKSEFTYTPEPNFGSKSPKHQGKLCYGVDLSQLKKLHKVSIEYILDAYNKTPKSESFFGPSFTIHAGSKTLEDQIKRGLTATEIHDSWQPQIQEFVKTREKYLLYD
ncbi:MAG: DUF1343 domain-containing protein [Lutibacter sp.]|nr:DUF1343 domain-containing protein [Lutibacter sp.]MBP9600311.1 DUF1343 domain-containing protein [Lutibacter sp.]